MAKDIKAEAVIELETSSLVAGSKKVEKEFKKIGDTAKKSGQKSDTAMNKTATSATKVASKIKETGTAGVTAGDKIAAGANKGSRALDQMGNAAGGAENSMETLSTSLIGLAAGASGVSDAIFGLRASFVGLEKTGFGIKGMEVAIRRMEEDLIVTIQTGTATIRELERSTEDLGLAYEALSLEEKQVDADTLALNGQIVTLTINIAATVAQSIIAISALKTMRLVTAQNTITTAGDSAAKAANTGITATMTGALVSAAAATRALTISMLTSPLAPYAIAAIGVGAAFIALNDNIGGVRDSIEDLTGLGRGSIPTLGFSFTGLEEKVEDADEGMDEFQQTAKDFTDNIDRNTIPTLDAFTDQVGLTAVSLRSTLTPSLSGVTNGLKAVGKEARNAGKELDEFKKKRESISAARDFRDLSREDQDLSLIGKTGTFSRVGTNILGFRGPEFLSGGRTFRSRITSKNFTLGGQASQAIAAFQSQPTPIGPGTPAHILGRIRKRDAFMSSLAGAILAALGRRGLGRKASRAYDRAGVWPVVAIVREGIEKGFLTMGYVRELLENTSSANGAAGVISSLAAQVQQLDEENEARLLQISEDSGLSVSDVSNLEKTEEGILQINQAILDTETQKGIDAFDAEQAAIQSSIDLRGITSFDQREKLISSMM